MPRPLSDTASKVVQLVQGGPVTMRQIQETVQIESLKCRVLLNRLVYSERIQVMGKIWLDDCKKPVRVYGPARRAA